MLRLIIVGSLLSLAVFGCKSNPYPAEGEYFQNPIVQRPVLPPYSLDVPSVVEFTENYKGSFEVKAVVPAPNLPVITVENLPRGAVFDQATSKIEWTPDFTQGNNPNDPLVNVMVYKIRITLRDNGEGVTAISREVALIVRDAPRPLELKSFQTDMSVNEGEELVQEVIVNDTDFPQGPFEVAVDGLPAGTLVEKGADTSKITLKYTPGFKVVTDDNSSWSADYKELKWSVTVTNPRGHVLKVPARWTVYDKRQPVRIVAPALINQGFGNDPNVKWGKVGPGGHKVTVPKGISNDLTLNFMVHAEDPNGEVIPVISNLTPEAGEIEVVPVAESKGIDGSNPSSTVQIIWSKIPDTFKGKTSELSVQGCVRGTTSKTDACASQAVKVNFVLGAQ